MNKIYFKNERSDFFLSFFLFINMKFNSPVVGLVRVLIYFATLGLSKVHLLVVSVSVNDSIKVQVVVWVK